jgi:hypothetical protein
MTTRTYGAKDSGGFYFQSDSAQSNSARRAEKAKGNAGTPLRLNAKLSAVLRDTKEGGVVFVADNGGGVRRVDCKVCGYKCVKCSGEMCMKDMISFGTCNTGSAVSDSTRAKVLCKGRGELE